LRVGVRGGCSGVVVLAGKARKEMNIFGAKDIDDQLRGVRSQIENAYLIAAGIRSCCGNVPDLLKLRKLEMELVVRRELATFPKQTKQT
jgi:hypothetical protein